MKKLFFMFSIFLLFISCNKKQNTVVSKPKKTETEKNESKDKVKPGSDVSAEEGGNGFENVAESLGYKTAKPVDHSNPNAVKGGTFRYSLSDYPAVFRPYGPNSNSIYVAAIEGFIYGYLGVYYSDESKSYVRYIFNYWKFSEDGKTAWFRINPKVHFSDGESLTSDDIIATNNLIIDEDLADPMNREQSKKYKITKISKYIIKVEIPKKAWKDWLYFDMYIMPAKYLSKIDAKTYLKKYSKDFMPSLGPYIFDKERSKEGELVVLKRNKDWWGYTYPENQHIYNFDTIEIKIIREPSLEKENFKKGKIDIYTPTPTEWYDELKKQGNDFDPIKRNLIVKKVLFNYAAKNTRFITFNLQKKPFDDINLRKAISMGFNKDILIKKLYHDDYVKYFSLFPFTDWASEKLKNFYNYDPQKAAELLDKAGYNIIDKDGIRKNDKGQRLEFEMSYYKGPINPKIHIQFQQDMKAIGVKVNLQVTDFSNIIKKLDDRDFNLILIGFGGLQFPNPKSSLYSALADQKNNNNLSGFKNDEVDELIEKYDLENDPQKRYDYIHKIDEIVAQNYITIHLWTAPFAGRFMYWNKFGTAYPYSGSNFTLAGKAAIPYWYVDPKKEKELEKAKSDKSMTLEEGDLIVDPYGAKPSEFNIKNY